MNIPKHVVFVNNFLSNLKMEIWFCNSRKMDKMT